MLKAKNYKTIEIQLKAAEEKEQRIFECIMTAKSLDADNEVLLPEGADYKEFLKRGTVFFNHKYDFPIGKVLSIKKSKDNITAIVQLIKRPSGGQSEIYNLADYVYESMKQGIIKGVSVGFTIKEGGIRKPNKRDIENYGKDVKNIITRWKLIELSVAPLQSNSDAVITSVKNQKQTETIDLVLKQKKDKNKEITKFVEIELRKRSGNLYY